VPVDHSSSDISDSDNHSSPVILFLPPVREPYCALLLFLLASIRLDRASILDETFDMAHIANLMVEKTNSIGLNNHIARELSPHSPHDAVRTLDFLAASAATVSNKYIGYGTPPNR
jgi:hypothetical protein